MATFGDARRWRKQGRGYTPPPAASTATDKRYWVKRATDAEARAAELETALDSLVGQCFDVAVEKTIGVNSYPEFHIALDTANRLVKKGKGADDA